jgi:hypothetical protein
MRTTNPIDFWRGIALIFIFVDHVPGNVYANFTLQAFAVCDAAELFVFLAGWSLSYATGGPLYPDPPSRIVFRLLSRAIELYRAQLVISLLALALLATAALTRANPLFIEWNNAGTVFYDPIRGLIGIVLLTHQLHFVDILPLYIVLLVMAVPMALMARLHLPTAIVLSATIYLIALVTRVNLPSWPGTEGWFFNPLSWQLVLMLGFAAGEYSQSTPKLRSTGEVMAAPALLAVGLFAAVAIFDLGPDPILVPEPRLLFLLDKAFVSPLRIANLLALVCAFALVYERYRAYVPDRASFWLCAMGRNSLAVFGIGSLLSLCGQFTRFVMGGGFLVDTLILFVGVLGMGFTCWFVEWRERAGSSRRSSSRSSAPPA